MQRLAHEAPGAVSGVPAALRRLGDALTDGLVGTRAGRILWANERLVALAGESDVAGLLGMPFEALFEDGGAGLPSDEHGRPVECVLRRSDGHEMRVIVRNLGSGGEEGPDRLWLLTDVTRQSRLEEELLRAGRDLHAANREIATLRDRMRRELADREELLTVVSHELRTPVTVILGYSRLLLSGKVGPLGDEQRRFLTETQKSCQRLDAFIANLLETARNLGGDAVLETSELPVGATIAGVASFLKPLLEARKLEISVPDGTGGLRARFDPSRVEQVLTNLLGNAIKLAPAGSRIDVSLRAVRCDGAPFVEVEVADRGPGVAEADRGRIFDPWVRVGEGSQTGGLGLGLAIARRIVEAHGGAIGVRPREGGGSCFHFTLPAADGPVGEAP